MSYKIQFYARTFNDDRYLSEISMSFIPRIDDHITLKNENEYPGYGDEVMGQVVKIEVNLIEGEEIYCLLGQVGSV